MVQWSSSFSPLNRWGQAVAFPGSANVSSTQKKWFVRNPDPTGVSCMPVAKTFLAPILAACFRLVPKNVAMCQIQNDKGHFPCPQTACTPKPVLPFFGLTIKTPEPSLLKSEISWCYVPSASPGDNPASFNLNHIYHQLKIHIHVQNMPNRCMTIFIKVHLEEKKGYFFTLKLQYRNRGRGHACR